MNKRGQGGLSMNTIIVAIIAIIILLLLVTFFTGGLSTIGQRITDVFKTGTSGYSLDLAIKNCQDYKARAESLMDSGSPVTVVKQSAYCKQTFVLEGETQERPCWDNAIGVTSTKVTSTLCTS